MSFQKPPKISVLMPVYNCEDYVSESINSILNQSFNDFELIIIDDASTDGTLDIVKTFLDSRIVLIEKEKNTGYTNSLNYGLSIAKGEYIARMDGDDISLPNRFEVQLNYMERHHEVIACGTAFRYINQNVVKRPPLDHENIKTKLLDKSCFGHPTVMLRKSVILDNELFYDTSMEPAEDYDLWVRLVELGKLSNIGKVLLHYRDHVNQVSKTREKEKIENHSKIKYKALNLINLNLNKDEDGLLKSILNRSTLTCQDIKSYKDLKIKIIQANQSNFFEKEGFNNYLQNLESILFKDFFLYNLKYKPSFITTFYYVRHHFGYNLQRKELFKLFIKSLILYKK